MLQTATIPVVPRVPLVPGITATRENLRQTAEFLRDLGVMSCDLLPYNPAVSGKLERLGKQPVRQIPDAGINAEQETEMREFFRASLY
jgi:pyruvate formate lyase activating enzyme